MPRFAMRSSEELAPGLENMRVLRWVNEDGEPSEEAEIAFIPGDIAPGQVAVPPAEPSSSGGASGRLLVSARLSTLRRSQKTSRHRSPYVVYGTDGVGADRRNAERGMTGASQGRVSSGGTSTTLRLGSGRRGR